MPHGLDSSGRTTTTAPHEANFNTVFAAGAPGGVTAVTQNSPTTLTKKYSTDSSGRLKTDGDGR